MNKGMGECTEGKDVMDFIVGFDWRNDESVKTGRVDLEGSEGSSKSIESCDSVDGSEGSLVGLIERNRVISGYAPRN